MDQLQTLLAQADHPGAMDPADDPWRLLEWLEQVDRHLDEADASATAQALRCRRTALESALAAFHETLRADLRQGHRAGLARWLDEYRRVAGPVPAEAQGFDVLDDLLAGLLRLQAPATPEVALAAEMVAYQPTPARHVLDLLARTAPGPDDVLVDIGAGLGQVPLLAALCSPARALGIEIEPTLVRGAREAVQALGLAGRVDFLCQDACTADLSAGTLFHLYTPLRGALLAGLLARLREQAARRPLRVSGFGPCVDTLLAQDWLRPDGPVGQHRVTLFSSRWPPG